MSFLSKLAFWKKEDEFGLSDQDLGLNSAQDDPFNMSPDMTKPVNPSAFSAPQSSQPSYNLEGNPYMPPSNYSQPQHSSNDIVAKDIELISSKIDALRSAMDTINQRLIYIEHHLREEKENKYKW